MKTARTVPARRGNPSGSAACSAKVAGRPTASSPLPPPTSSAAWTAAQRTASVKVNPACARRRIFPHHRRPVVHPRGPRVRAERDRHAQLPSRCQLRELVVERAACDARVATGKGQLIGVSLHRDGRGHPHGPPLGHAREVLLPHEKPVLDQAAPGHHGHPDGLLAVGVHHDVPPAGGRGLHGGAELLQAELRSGPRPELGQAVRAGVDDLDVVAALRISGFRLGERQAVGRRGPISRP